MTKRKEMMRMTEVVLSEDCIEKIADVVAKKIRNATKPTREAKETMEATVERRLRDLCE